MTTYTLTTPVTHNGKTYSELTFRKPKVGDLLVMDAVKGELTRPVALLASLCDMPLPAFKEIDGEDFQGIMEATGNIVGESHSPTASGAN